MELSDEKWLDLKLTTYYSHVPKRCRLGGFFLKKMLLLPYRGSREGLLRPPDGLSLLKLFFERLLLLFFFLRQHIER
jgi:hypothetical protein